MKRTKRVKKEFYRDLKTTHPKLAALEQAIVDKFLDLFNSKVPDDEYFKQTYELLGELKLAFEANGLDYRKSAGYDYISNVKSTGDPYYLLADRNRHL